MSYFVLDPAAAEAAPTVSLALGPDDDSSHPSGKSLAVIRARIKLELGNRTDLTNPVLSELINDAYLDLVSSLDLPELRQSYAQTLVEGQSLYTLPSSVSAVVGVSAAEPDDETTGATLRKIDWAEFRKLPDDTGEPSAWFRYKNLVVFWPRPEDAFPVAFDVKVKPAPLEDADDYPIIDDKWHEALYKAAKARAWEAVQNDTKAALSENAAARLIQRRSDQEAEEAENEYPSIRPIRSHRDLMALRRRPQRLEPGE